MSRLRYFAHRTAITVALIFLVASSLFVFFRLMPGDYSSLLVQQGMNADQIARLEAKWGLNAPLHEQYVRYITNLLTADAGQSFRHNAPVWDLVRPRIINSAILVFPAITATYIIGSLVGTVIGRYRGGLFEKSSIITVSVFHSIPDFFLGILLIAAFSQTINIFPTSGMLSTETAVMIGGEPFWHRFFLKEFWMHYALPFATITLYFMQYPALIMRNSVVEVSNQEFLHYHRLKGLPRPALLRKLMRHASLPVVTLYPISLASSISGLVLIEIVFNWPGIGRLLVDSVLARDFPVIQFVFLVAAVWVILGNFLVDLLYGVIDPRVSVGNDNNE
ncbi:dipeptide transporter permease DppB [Halalkalicoccus paucihalophilus]|uniref:Dipeptide transporter permease DppB n=1 Tax=Halalkalicoccus paucihalophilus TaxID=1008153 RepID=A0A151A9E1_9EURY|nr:ABC transporter permease [Halalkalicoccus paucihalophilus]KYH23997.1 dipeptide transporter permease DppB [Halalkalicoccus paucihalophilus]